LHAPEVECIGRGKARAPYEFGCKVSIATPVTATPPSNPSSATSSRITAWADRINAVLAAAGYNFSLLLRWFEELLRVLSLILWHALLAVPLHLTRCRKTFFTAD
jgi:hypothetical protein